MYILLLASTIVSDVLYEIFGFGGEGSSSDDKNSVQKIGLIVNVVFYCISFFWLVLAYKSYAKSGGIKGYAASKEDLEQWLEDANIKDAKKAGKIKTNQSK